MTADEYKKILREVLCEQLEVDDSLKSLLSILDEVGEEHGSSPQSYAISIKDTGEKAHQRAILLSPHKSVLGATCVKWLDMELPVIFGPNPRRPSFDLIGETDDGRLALCELKYNMASRNNPTYALFEILIYYYHIWRNANALQENRIWHRKMHQVDNPWDWNKFNDPKNVILIVAGNKTYWDGWETKQPAFEIGAKLEKAIPSLSIRFFCAPDPQISFPEQSAGETYTPSLGKNDKTPWEEMII